MRQASRCSLLGLSLLLHACPGDTAEATGGASTDSSTGGGESGTDGDVPTGDAPGTTSAGPETGGGVDMPAPVEDDDEWSLVFAGTPGDAVSTAAGAILDGSGDGLNATAGDGLVVVAGHPWDAVGVALRGDGAGLRVDDPRVALIADLAAEDPLTLEVGFKSDAHAQDGSEGAGVLFERPDGFVLAIEDGFLNVTIAAADAGPSATLRLEDRAVSDGRWHRAIVRRDPATQVITLTLDGAFTATMPDPTAGLAVRGAPTFMVGAAADGSRGLLGAVDHVRVLRRASAPFVTAPGATATVFKGGAEPVPNGGTYTSVRIPAIVRALDGSLFAVAEGRVDDSCDFGNIDAVAKRSEDGGATWSALQRIADNGTGKVGNPIPIVDEAAGRLVLLTSYTDVEGGACSDPVGGTFRVKVQHSEDHGVSWSAPVDITEQIVDPAWNESFLLGPSHGIQLREGANAGTLVVHTMHRRMSDNARGGHLIISSDGGDSWQIAAREDSSAPEVQVNEGSVAELSDGRLYVNVRHQVADPAPEREKGLRGQAFVGTDLQFVGEPPFTRNPAFRGPVVHGTTLRWPGSERYGDAARVLFSYPAGESGTNFGQRHDLRVYVSHDDAASFSRGWRVFGGKASYSDLVVMDDGRVGVLFENARDNEDYNARIDFKPLIVQSLDDPTALAWTFEDGAVGAEVTTTKTVGTAPALTAEGVVIRATGRHHSAAARFNNSRLCASAAELAHLADLDIRDGFAVEVVFRTDAHKDGGSQGAGALVTKTAVGTQSAWWLRVEDGQLRFAVGDALGNLDIVTSEVQVADGAYHTAVATRDVEAGVLRVVVDGGKANTAKITTKGLVTNDEPLCVGAFAGDGVPRAFTGEIDAVAVRLTY